MTNYQNWKASKDFYAMQEEFQDLASWGDCHCCPAQEQCESYPFNLCGDTELLRIWADTEVTTKG